MMPRKPPSLFALSFQPVLHASGNCDWIMQTWIFVCTGKFKSLRIFDHICMHICVHICMHICKHTRCISVSYLCHILKGIKYISVKISSFLDRVLIWGFKMWSKLPTYHDREGSSSWSRWLSRNDHEVSSNCAVHIKINVCKTKLRLSWHMWDRLKNGELLVVLK